MLRECRVGGPEVTDKNNCTGPCVTEDWQLNKDPTVTVYRRGETATMVWARNNHQGGFVRFALVPLEDRMELEAHDKYAFHYACYETGEHDCPKPEEDDEYCGTDRRLYRTNVTIPKVYPDGRYILGWSWYGGIAGTTKIAFFGDYWSCSHVEIEGGSFEDEVKPVFSPDEGEKGCYSGVNELGVCFKEPCPNGGKHPAATMIPEKFSLSDDDEFVTKKVIKRSDLDTDYTERLRPTSTPEPEEVTPTPTSRVTSSVVKSKIDAIEIVDISNNNKLVADRFDYRDPINLKKYGHIALVAQTTGEFDKVEFFINGIRKGVEGNAPYVLNGSKGDMYSDWEPPLEKVIRVKVVGHPRKGDKVTKEVKMKFENK